MVLKVNNLSLPLQYTPMGPVLSTEDKFLEPIAWIVNPAVTGEEPQIADSLARKEDVSLLMRYAVRPTPEDDDLSEARTRWHELTGEEPGEDIYILGTGFTYHEVVLPRQTLLSILQTLLKLRAQVPKPPPAPWLFRRLPYDLGPGEGEKELVCGLEERAALYELLEQEQSADMTGIWKMIRDYEAAGLFSEALSKQKQMLLELWSCPTLLAYHRAALTFLNHFRSQTQPLMLPVTPGAAPVAVLNASICSLPHHLAQKGWHSVPDETRYGVVSYPLAGRSAHRTRPCEAARTAQKAELIELEQRAHAFSRMLEQEESDNRAFEVALSALVRDLEAAGLFSDAYVEEKEPCLRICQYPTLETYHRAAIDFLNHFRSQASQAVPKGASGMPLLSLSISIDKLEFPYVAAYSSFDGA